MTLPGHEVSAYTFEEYLEGFGKIWKGVVGLGKSGKDMEGLGRARKGWEG